MERRTDHKTGNPILSLNGYTATVHADDQMENPSDEDGWTVYSFNRRHASFKDPDELGIGPPDKDGNPTITDPGLRSKLRAGTAFFLSYYEHTLCLWMIMDGRHPAGVEFTWDGCRIAGLVRWEQELENLGPKTYSDRMKDAEGFIENYTHWCNGWVYFVNLTDPEGNDIENSGPCYGVDKAEKVAEEMLDEHAKPAKVKA